jgi:hypothetical protein
MTACCILILAMLKMTKTKNIFIVLKNSTIRFCLFSTFLVFTGGVWFSVIWNDWTAFARSGCLVACVALVLVYRDWSKGIIENRLKTENSLNRLQKDSSKAEAVEVLRPYLEELWDEADANLYLQNDYKRNIELIVALLGSFVWGFGDLIPCFLK